MLASKTKGAALYGFLALLMMLAATGCMGRVKKPVGLRVTPYYWMPKVEAKIQSGTLGADIIDIGETLNVDESLKAPAAEVTLEFADAAHQLRAGYWSTDTSGLATLTRDITFGDITFNTAETVRTNIDAKVVEAGYLWNILNFDCFSLGPTVQVDLWNVNARLRSETTMKDESVGGKLPIPSAGLGGELRLFGQRLVLTARGTAIGYGRSSYANLMGLVRVQVVKHVALGGGYRHIAVDYEDDRFDEFRKLDMALSGAFGALMIQF